MSTEVVTSNAQETSRPFLRIAVPPLSIQRLSNAMSSPKKEKPRVPSSGRGGLGNIRAAKISSLHPPLSPSSFYSSSTSPNAAPSYSSGSGSSAASLRSGSTVSDKRASGCTARSYSLSSGQGTGRPTSVSVSVYNHEHDSDLLSELGSPTSPSFKTCFRESVVSTNSANTFGTPLPYLRTSIPATSYTTKTTSPSVASSSSSLFKSPVAAKRGSGTSSEYALHLAADAAMRADEKRLQAIDDETSEQAGDNGKLKKMERTRTGRGGAGIYKETKGVDASLYPRTAALTHDHEMRLAMQEKLLVEASRARSATARSTGRGGAGNWGTAKAKTKDPSKGKENAEGGDRGKKRKSAPKVKGKGKGKIVAETMSGEVKVQVDSDVLEDVERTEASPPSRFVRHTRNAPSISGKRSLRRKSTIQVQRKGLSRLWSRVTSVATTGRTQVSVPVEFEIIELRPDFSDDLETPPSVNKNVARQNQVEAREICEPILAGIGALSTSLATAAMNGAHPLPTDAYHRVQLETISGDDAWVDDVQLNLGSNGVIIEVDSDTDSDIDPTCPPAGHYTTAFTFRPQRSVSAPSPHSSISLGRFDIELHSGSGSRDSIGTFGPTTSSSREEDENCAYTDPDGAESIMDPYMRS